MGKVFKVVSMHGDEVYVGTQKEADRHRFGGDELPEEVEKLDAAEECNRLQKEIDDCLRSIRALRNLLGDLVDMCPEEVLDTPSGQRAYRFIKANPLPPADSADRDGGRSYGGG